jgi:hypothetical protein
LMIVTLSALTLGYTATSVQSASPGSGTIDIRSVAREGSSHHNVAYRLCWREGGYRQCRWVDSARISNYRSGPAVGRAVPRAYGYTALPAMAVRPRSRRVYGYTVLPAITVTPLPPYRVIYAARPTDWASPDVYPTGSATWWRVMDQNNRGGTYGPSP